jgi:hypothetical protein
MTRVTSRSRVAVTEVSHWFARPDSKRFESRRLSAANPAGEAIGYKLSRDPAGMYEFS